jgi:hypothetical protein
MSGMSNLEKPVQLWDGFFDGPYNKSLRIIQKEYGMAIGYFDCAQPL